MKTRRANYPAQESTSPIIKKMRRSSIPTHESALDQLPDDLLLSIFTSISSSASSPADLINPMQTCKRFYAIAMHPTVLENASLAAITINASAWSEGAHRYLNFCADAGNTEACYTLGMIHFYCLESKSRGTSLMAKAAIASHAQALQSLAVIHFNGSGGTRKDKDLKAGAALCARAATLGHIDAMRELGHCLQDGYGLPKDVHEGRHLLLQANTREAVAANCTIAVGCFNSHRLYQSSLRNKIERPYVRIQLGEGGVQRHYAIHRSILHRACSLLSDFGCNVPPQKPHVAHQFLVDWFKIHPLPTCLRLCSYANCGRPETRKHEFRRCSACGTVNYCSRACQALDWKLCHKYDCSQDANWDDDYEEEGEEEGEEEEEEGGGGGGGGGGRGGEEDMDAI